MKEFKAIVFGPGSATIEETRKVRAESLVAARALLINQGYNMARTYIIQVKP